LENVLFLINHAGKAGTERYVGILAENAAGYGMRPFFAYNEPGPLLEKLRESGVTCRRLSMAGPFDLSAARNLARICDELRIAIVHTNYLRENYIAILTKTLFCKRLRVVYTNHFVTANNLSVRFANRVMTRANHRIISVCEAGAPNLIKNGNARNRIIVIHNAVDPQAWKPGPDYGDIRDQTRRLYGVGADETVFLCASRFAHDKGHSFLVESIQKMVDENGNDRLRVLLAGDGPLQDEVRSMVEARGLSDIVSFIGFVSDIKPLFYASDAYVNPSQHEAFSFLILEALASGLPVIATDMGGNREIVNDKHGCGTLIDYGDTEALCDAMQAYRSGAAQPEIKRLNAMRIIDTKFALGDMLAKTFASFY